MSDRSSTRLAPLQLGSIVLTEKINAACSAIFLSKTTDSVSKSPNNADVDLASALTLDEEENINVAQKQ